MNAGAAIVKCKCWALAVVHLCSTCLDFFFHEPVVDLSWVFFLVKKVVYSSKRYLITYPKTYHRITVLKRPREEALGKAVSGKLNPCLPEAGGKTVGLGQDKISL